MCNELCTKTYSSFVVFKPWQHNKPFFQHSHILKSFQMTKCLNQKVFLNMRIWKIIITSLLSFFL
jgi:hypothetical protein